MSVKALDFKSPEQILQSLKDTPPNELREIILSLLVLEPLLSAAQVAAREGMNVRDVRKAMGAGEMPHPLWGPGYICHGPNSKKVPASAVNAWRRRFFVPVNNDSNGSKK